MSESKPCSMEPEEAISVLQSLADYIGASFTKEKVKPKSGDWDVQDACILAISALRAQPANEPLTLEQLREMDGEIVHCIDINVDVKVSAPKVGIITVSYNIPGESGRCNAKGLTLYRRPPERSKDDA